MEKGKGDLPRIMQIGEEKRCRSGIKSPTYRKGMAYLPHHMAEEGWETENQREIKAEAAWRKTKHYPSTCGRRMSGASAIMEVSSAEGRRMRG